MIPLSLPLTSEAGHSFISRVREPHDLANEMDSTIFARDGDELILSGKQGLFSVNSLGADDIVGDVLLLHPDSKRAERLFRKGSGHNTLLVTERCDQLCVMCSQPPKKTHVDRFAYFEQACLLCEPDSMIGISGGEPTLYKEELFQLVERTAETRPDVGFHILSNGQHFTEDDVERLKRPAYRNVVWGIPLYAIDNELHDTIVGKSGAYDRLKQSFAWLMRAGARIELRTVLLTDNYRHLPSLSDFIASRLQFIECWSIMQLENIGFAKNRWSSLYWDHGQTFEMISRAIDIAQQRHVDVRLFNFARCTVPHNYRHLAPASISDWKRKYADSCQQCSEREKCAGFFEWHPDEAMEGVIPL